ncbi:MAG: helix-turn-helix domain-containing protein [Pseudomonadota bacterium]|nr:helix-turn-helix domain-containing protein [Pseudomonadota bacterium]
MLIQKLRLQRGWSQQQLAELSGLSTRTIQRIENGQTASTETLKALAAVFEVDFTQLGQESAMNPSTHSPAEASPDEVLALRHVRNLRGFYTHLLQYLLVVAGLAAVNLWLSPHYLWFLWVLFGWGVGIMSHALSVFQLLPWLGADWERRQVEKRLGRRL